MPVSKSKRKKGKSKGRRPLNGSLGAIFMPRFHIDNIEALITEAELACEIKLVRGECTYQDVASIRDILNMCTWSITYLDRITHQLSDDWVENQCKVFVAAQEAFHTFYMRGNAAGGVTDPTVRYIATGDECTRIRDGVIVAADVCHQLLRDSPIQFVKLFCRMKEFLGDHIGQKRIKFELDDLEHVIRRALNHGGRR